MQLLYGSITFGQVLLTILEVALLAVWIWVAVSVIVDVFRSPDLSNAAKAGWMLLIILIPLIGVLIYVIARGDTMKQREALEDLSDDAQRTGEEIQRVSDRRQGSGGTTTSQDLASLQQLKDRGLLTDEEFRRAKDKATA